MDQHTQRQMAAPQNFRLVDNGLIGIIIVTSCMLFLPGCSPVPSYTQDVQPILKANCIECHQPGGIGYEKSGLDMRTYDSLMKGTKYGPIIIPGDSYNSVLVELIEHRANPAISMPFHKQGLTPAEIATTTKWIDEGAKP